jgi:hypothetical protein
MHLLKTILVANIICDGVGLLIAVIGDWIDPPYYNLFRGAFAQNDVTLIGVIIFVLGGIAVSAGILAGLDELKHKKKKRKAFTQDTKDLVLQRQNHRCNACGISPSNWDFDHIGSRANNSPSNCQALCLDCHRDKTKREGRQRKRR